ncbi:MAG: response regulator [Magnetospirillum sp.]|nr:MAG: response regulator [Magnetospirillum sp.]
MARGRSTTFNVLLVEDDPGDAKLVTAAFADSPFNCRLEHVSDGVEAMMRLHAAAAGTDGTRLPDLMLLDLNMPRKNGHEVLAEVKADSRFRDIPVVVLTTSEAERDISAAYKAGASGFITKPVDVDTLFTSIRGIQDYWFGLSLLPR